MAQPVFNLTTPAPDPADALARQIMTLESTLHLLNSKSKHLEQQAAPSSGPRVSPGWVPPSSPSLWSLFTFLLFALLLKPSMAYEYAYYDCSQPAHLETFDRLALCQQTPTSTIPAQATPETWWLLQEAPSHELNGTSCEVRRSEFQGFCGVWGHTKLGGPPTVSATVTINAQECMEMVQTQKFVTTTTPAGWPIRLNEETSFTEMYAGRIWY